MPDIIGTKKYMYMAVLDAGETAVVALQDNVKLLLQLDFNESGGNVTGSSGFSLGTAFSLDTAAPELGADQVYLVLDSVNPADVASGAVGTVDMQIADAGGPINFTVDVAFRKLSDNAFTAFDGYVTSTPPSVPGDVQIAPTSIKHAPPGGWGTAFAWSAGSFTGLPLGLNVDVVPDAGAAKVDGHVAAYGGAWAAQDGTFELSIGSLSAAWENQSIFTSNLSLRVLSDLTLFENESLPKAGTAFSGAAADGGYTVGAAVVSGGATLAIDNAGLVTAFTALSFPEDQTADVPITDGGRPQCTPRIAVNYRMLFGNGHLVLRTQARGNDPITIGPGPHGNEAAVGYAFSSPGNSLTGLTLGFGALGDINSVNHTDPDPAKQWADEGTFDLTIQDGSRPPSTVTRNIDVREVVDFVHFAQQTSQQPVISKPSSTGAYLPPLFVQPGDGMTPMPPTTPTPDFDSNFAVIGYTNAGPNPPSGVSTFRMRVGQPGWLGGECIYTVEQRHLTNASDVALGTLQLVPGGSSIIKILDAELFDWALTGETVPGDTVTLPPTANASQASFNSGPGVSGSGTLSLTLSKADHPDTTFTINADVSILADIIGTKKYMYMAKETGGTVTLQNNLALNFFTDQAGAPDGFSVSGTTGFAIGTTFSVINPGGAANELALQLDGVNPSDVTGESVGTVDIDLDYGGSVNTVTVDVAFRRIDHLHYTVMQGYLDEPYSSTPGALSDVRIDPTTITSAPPAGWGAAYAWGGGTGLSGLPGTLSVEFQEQDGFAAKNVAKLAARAGGTWTNEDGSFDFTIGSATSSWENSSEFTVALSVRSFSALTLFENQLATTTTALSAGPTASWTQLTATAVTGGGSVAIDAAGLITGHTAGGGYPTDEVMDLTVQDDTRPTCVAKIDVAFRTRTSAGYTVLEGHVDGEGNIVGAAAVGYTVGVEGSPSVSGGGTVTLGFGADADVSSASHAGGTNTWNDDGTFVMTIQDGSRPPSRLNSDLSLRRFPAGGMTYFDQQDSLLAQPALGAAADGGYAIVAVDPADSDTPLPGGTPQPTFDGSGALVGYDTPAFPNGSDTRNIRVKDGSRPYSVTPLTVDQRWIADSTDAQVVSLSFADPEIDFELRVRDTQNWDWQTPALSGLSSGSVSFMGGTTGVDAATVDLTGADGTGLLTFELTQTDHPTVTIELPLTVSVALPDPVPVTPVSLPTGRARMRYESTLTAAPPDPGSTAFVRWTLDSMTSKFELVDPADPTNFGATIDTAGDEVVIRTIAHTTPSLAVEYLDDAPGGTTLSIDVTAEALDGGLSSIAGPTQTNLSLPVEETLSSLDVGILLDRSGSMSGAKWDAARSGAAMFMQLIEDAATAPAPGHRVGVYTFNGGGSFGTDNWAGGANEGTWYRTFEQDGTIQDLGAVSQPRIDSINAAIADATPTLPTASLTAMGSGMLYTRDKLMGSADPARTRVVLALTDGMENRAPMFADVFPGPGAGDWYSAGDPAIRVYGTAVLTGDTMAQRLRDASAATGGIPALDVKLITDPLTANIDIENWFINMFKSLFDYSSALQPPDPELDIGDTATVSVDVNLGHDKIVFYALLGEKGDPSDWFLEISPPGTSLKLDASAANGTPGLAYRAGAMYRTYTIDRPLQIPGYEHLWAGTWTAHLTRKGGSNPNYALGAMVHSDLQVSVDVIAPPIIRPGDEVGIRVTLGIEGKPIDHGRARVVITQPGPWAANEALKPEAGVMAAELAQTKGELYAGDTSNFDRRIEAVRKMQSGTPKPSQVVTLVNVGNGVFERTFKLDAPGQWNLDTSIVTYRPGSNREVYAKLSKGIQVLPRYYSASKVSAHWSHLRKFAGRRQLTRIESRDQVHVQFVPHPGKSRGWIRADERRKTLELSVQPRDEEGRMLGAGWGPRVHFRFKKKAMGRIDAVDAGDGSYRASLPLKVAGKLGLDVPAKLLQAKSLEFDHTRGSVRGRRLSLDGFSAVALGVEIPLDLAPPGKGDDRPTIPGKEHFGKLLEKLFGAHMGRLIGKLTLDVQKLLAAYLHVLRHAAELEHIEGPREVEAALGAAADAQRGAQALCEQVESAEAREVVVAIAERARDFVECWGSVDELREEWAGGEGEKADPDARRRALEGFARDHADLRADLNALGRALQSMLD